MARVLALVLGLAAVAFAVKYALDSTAASGRAGVTEPRRQLDNVRTRAKELEQELQRGADRAADATR